jgi:FkbM family methyltransferase
VRINRPEYVFRPSAALKRLRFGTEKSHHGGEIADVDLPWSQTITVLPDGIGRNLAVSGVFDLCVTESIHRLLDPGDMAVDVGANVGYLTNLMATRVGPTGSVLAFEPHPVVFEVLERNVSRWNADERIGSPEARRLALSSEDGAGRLSGEGDFETHMGLASVRDDSEGPRPGDFEVELARLDRLLDGRSPQLIKIDVEGHEIAVLEGAQALLGERRVRDVVFEEHGIYPTASMTLLERHGMTVFTLDHTLLGLRVRPVREGPAPAGWPGPNYLATFEPNRALTRLGGRGWSSLGLGARADRPAR